MKSHSVTHPKFPPESLNGKQAAYCERGNYQPLTLTVRNQTATGFVLLASYLTLDDSGERIMGRPLSASLDQETVNKITVPEPDSFLQQMGFDFVIIQDADSAHLARKRV